MKRPRSCGTYVVQSFTYHPFYSFLFLEPSILRTATMSGTNKPTNLQPHVLTPESWGLRPQKKSRAQIPMKVWSHMWRQYASWRHIILIKKRNVLVLEKWTMHQLSLYLSFSWRKELDQRDPGSGERCSWNMLGSWIWGEILNWYSSATFAQEFRYGIRLCGLPMLPCFVSFVPLWIRYIFANRTFPWQQGENWEASKAIGYFLSTRADRVFYHAYILFRRSTCVWIWNWHERAY